MEPIILGNDQFSQLQGDVNYWEIDTSKTTSDNGENWEELCEDLDVGEDYAPLIPDLS